MSTTVNQLGAFADEPCRICPDYNGDGQTDLWEWGIAALEVAGYAVDILTIPSGEGLAFAVVLRTSVKGLGKASVKTIVLKGANKISVKGSKNVVDLAKFGKHGKEVYKGFSISKDYAKHGASAFKLMQDNKRISTLDKFGRVLKK